MQREIDWFEVAKETLGPSSPTRPTSNPPADQRAAVREQARREVPALREQAEQSIATLRRLARRANSRPAAREMRLISREKTRFAAFAAADAHQYKLFMSGVSERRFPTHVQVVPSPWWCLRRKYSVVER